MTNEQEYSNVIQDLMLKGVIDVEGLAEDLKRNVDKWEAAEKKSLVDRARNEAKDYGLIGIFGLVEGGAVCAANYQNLIDEIKGYAILAYDKLAGITPSPEIFDGRYDGMYLPAVIASGLTGAGALWCANRRRKEAKKLEQ